NGVVLVALLGAAAYVRPARAAYLVRRAASFVRRPVRLALGLGVLAFGAIAGQGGPSVERVAEAAPAPAAAQPLNVLILAADSLRADRLEPRVAPHLSELAARSTRFDRAYVSLPRTFPSWVNILTGRHAHHHGVRSMFPTWEERAKDFDAMPERFARAGYRT